MTSTFRIVVGAPAVQNVIAVVLHYLQNPLRSIKPSINNIAGLTEEVEFFKLLEKRSEVFLTEFGGHLLSQFAGIVAALSVKAQVEHGVAISNPFHPDAIRMTPGSKFGETVDFGISFLNSLEEGLLPHLPKVFGKPEAIAETQSRLTFFIIREEASFRSITGCENGKQSEGSSQDG